MIYFDYCYQLFSFSNGTRKNAANESFNGFIVVHGRGTKLNWSKTCLLNIETMACKLTPDNGQFRATFELCLRKTASQRTQLSNMKLVYFISYRRLENSVDMCLPKFDLYRGTIAPNFLITIQTLDVLPDNLPLL